MQHRAPAHNLPLRRGGHLADGCSTACNIEQCYTCTGTMPSVCTPKSAGSACNDGLFCNGADTCNMSGACSGHAGDPCPGPDGDNDCKESCNEGTDSCTANDPNGSACTDGMFCTGTDTCMAGTCSVHTGDPCPGPDGDANCAESCNEADDDCTANDPEGSSCADDANLCTVDQCDGQGTCEHPRIVRLDRPGNANQKGSLLMFAKIAVDSARGVDTLVDLTNAGDADVTVTCYWVDGATWEKVDFHFDLTKRQPSYFRASDGLPGAGGAGVPPFPSDPGKGELKCWASDAFGAQIKHNFLKGEATVTDATNATSWEYAATGFQCRLPVKNGAPCGDPGTIRLEGCGLDPCRATLELDFFSTNDKTGQSRPLGGRLDTDLALPVYPGPAPRGRAGHDQGEVRPLERERDEVHRPHPLPHLLRPREARRRGRRLQTQRAAHREGPRPHRRRT
jgi:hypothetical protein